MKFIIRNLGWILLIAFFVFMLYLISNQNNKQNINNLDADSGSIFITNKNKKEINKNIDSNVIKIVSNEVSINKKLKNSHTNTGSIINKIIKYFKSENSFNNNNISKEDLQKKVKIKKNIDSTGVVDDELIKKVENILSVNNGEKKLKVEKKIDNENNIRKVGVKSVFLNNAYFTKRLYTAYKGDKLEQLTKTNKYGCFQVKVIFSKNKINNGKVAWTCEYYMEGKTQTIKKYKIVAKEYYKKIRKNLSNFKVNTYHKVKVKALKLNNSTFNKKLGIVYFGDELKQLTKTNRYGCFEIKVISSKAKVNNGKIAWACQKYLK